MSPIARAVSLLVAAVWAGFALHHAVSGRVESHVPSLGFSLACVLSLAAPYFYRRVRHWPRHGYTALLLTATLFSALLATIDVALH